MQEEQDKQNQNMITLSVRDFVEFAYQHGSIDTRFGGASRAREGAMIHRRLQKSMGSSYQAEVTLKYQRIFHNHVFNLWGRADGVVFRNGIPVLVDEIKTTTRNIMMISENDYPEYFAQARTYAWMLCSENRLKEIEVQLTFYQVPSGTIRQIKEKDSFKSLCEYVDKMFQDWSKWINLRDQLTIQRNNSIRNMSFPFEGWRKGQHQIASAVYRTIEKKGKLVCQAPTGIGKTMGILIGSLHALARGNGNRIYYATARTTGAEAVEKALTCLQERSGLSLRYVTFVAKDKICLKETRKCNPDDCQYADHFYDRVKPAVYELLRAEQKFDSQKLITASKKYCLCPFELSLYLGQWCDVIIGDYNYIYDPVIALQDLSENENGVKTILLVDEAHHLVERVRDMYSNHLICKKNFMEIRKNTRQINGFYKALTAVIDYLEHARVVLTDRNELWRVEKKFPHELLQHLRKVAQAGDMMISQLTQQRKSIDEKVLDFYFEIRRILVICDSYGEESRTSFAVSDDHSDIHIGIHCLDPASAIFDSTQMCQSVIYFSATLSPLVYFKRFLGGTQMSLVNLDSPYNADHFLVLTADQISTRYKYRQQTFKQISEMLIAFVQGHKGNYLFYFPSYAYMNLVYQDFIGKAKREPLNIIRQNQEMSPEEKEAYLDQFQQDQKKSLVGFAILGSSFGESIDLTGESLIGVAIIGVGLPMISRENDMLRDYFQNQNHQGYNNAYMYPGFSKVLQAMGRVIRTEVDRGVALLIDDRYKERRYRELFPKYINTPKRVRNISELRERLDAFWGKH